MCRSPERKPSRLRPALGGLSWVGDLYIEEIPASLAVAATRVLNAGGIPGQALGDSGGQSSPGPGLIQMAFRSLGLHSRCCPREG